MSTNWLSYFANNLVRIDHRLTTPYHPRANGAAERMVQTVKMAIHKMIDGEVKDWDRYVPAVQLAYNSKIAPLHNSAPFSLMFVRRLNAFKDYRSDIPSREEPIAPYDDDDLVTRINAMAKIVMPAINKRVRCVRKAAQVRFNKKQRLIEFPVGLLVAIEDPTRRRKTNPKYEGTFIVHAKTNNDPYILKDKTGDIIRPSCPPSALKSVSEDPLLKDCTHYVIEAIVNHRGSPGNYEYKVRWKGYDAKDDTWEPADSFDSPTMINQYWRRRSAK